MRKVKRLNFCDYIIPLGRHRAGVMCLSNDSNILLKKTWHFEKPQPETKIQAKYNTDLSEGITVLIGLYLEVKTLSSVFISGAVFRVSDSDYTTTLIGSLSPTLVGQEYQQQIPQSFFSTNQLSGAETYMIEVVLQRRRKKYKKRVYFNHLGCFDYINRIDRQINVKEIIKVDE